MLGIPATTPRSRSILLGATKVSATTVLCTFDHLSNSHYISQARKDVILQIPIRRPCLKVTVIILFIVNTNAITAIIVDKPIRHRLQSCPRPTHSRSGNSNVPCKFLYGGWLWRHLAPKLKYHAVLQHYCWDAAANRSSCHECNKLWIL